MKLSATDNIHLASHDETGKADHYSYTKKSGLFGGGGFGFTIGNKSEKTTTKEQTLGAVGSTIGSEKGNIDNTINTYDSQTKYE